MAIRFDARTNSVTTDANSIGFDQPITTPASTATLAGLNIAEGVTPSAPIDGDIWVTAGGAFNVRLNGATVDLAAASGGNVSNTGTPINNQIAVWTDATTIEGSSDITWNGTIFTVGGNASFSKTTINELSIVEQAAADVDVASEGQIWVRDDAPNTLMYTDDAGNDFTANNVHEIEYEYSSAVTSTDPGAGVLNFNSVTIGSIATLYIDDVDNTGRDNSYLLSNLADGDILSIRSASDPADYIVASINGAPTDSTGFWTIGLTLIHTGTIFTNTDPVRITVEWMSQASGVPATSITVTTNNDGTEYMLAFTSATAATTGNYSLLFDTSVNPTFNPLTSDLTSINLSATTGTFTNIAATGASQLNITGMDETDVGMVLQDGMSLVFGDRTSGNQIEMYNDGVGGSDASLVIDKVATFGDVTINIPLRIADNQPIVLGAGSDMQLSSDGTDVTFDMPAGTDWKMTGGNTSTEVIMQYIADEGVELYYNGVLKFDTVDQTAADMISGATVLDAEGNMQPVGIGVCINDSTTFDTAATHTPFQQGNVNEVIYWVGTGASNFDTYTNVEAGQTNIPVGAMWIVQCNGSGTLVIRGGASVTMRFWDASGAPADADVTVARGGVATVRKVSDSIYDVWGSGLS